MAKKKTTISTRSKITPKIKVSGRYGLDKEVEKYDRKRVGVVNDERATVKSAPMSFKPRRVEEKVDLSSVPKAVRLYPPPNNHPTFMARWRSFVLDVVKRENFKAGHLYQLEVLCDLFVEYHEIQKSIYETGYSYESIGRNGIQIKKNPMVDQLNNVRTQIALYTKILGLVPAKDKEESEFEDDKKSKEQETEETDEAWD